MAKVKKSVGEQLKEILSRNQRWLSQQIDMEESMLSNKINGFKQFTEEDITKINQVLKTDFKL